MLSSPPSKWRDRLVNQLAKAAEAAAPGLAGLRVKLAAQLGLPVCLTGSGSAMFALYDSVAEARDALTRICPPLTERCCIVQSNPW